MTFVHVSVIVIHTCVSGCMYHPAELNSGRNTWDSYPAGGPKRRQWAPVNSRPWSQTNRSAKSIIDYLENRTLLLFIMSTTSLVEPIRDVEISLTHNISSTLDRLAVHPCVITDWLHV